MFFLLFLFFLYLLRLGSPSFSSIFLFWVLSPTFPLCFHLFRSLIFLIFLSLWRSIYVDPLRFSFHLPGFFLFLWLNALFKLIFSLYFSFCYVLLYSFISVWFRVLFHPLHLKTSPPSLCRARGSLSWRESLGRAIHRYLPVGCHPL